jgi:2,3-dihydroxybenzoate decarboxylase
MAMQGKIALEEHFAPPDTFEVKFKYVSTRLPAWPEFERRQVNFFEQALRDMDKTGVEMSITSLGAPAIQALLDPKEAAEAARKTNDFLKARIDEHPGRLAGFAALPMQDPEAAARELTRCVRELGFVGALVNGFTQSQEPDSALYYDLPRYLPFWEEVEKLDVPFYLHPRNPMADQLRIYEGHPWFLGSAWAFGVETSTHALRLMASGLFDKCPGLKIVLGHLGEGLPSSIWRVDHRIKLNGERTPAKKPLAEYFRSNFHITTSGNFHDSTLAAALTELGADRIMYSVDYPFEYFEEAAEWFDRAAISEADRQKIGRLNALSLFKLK